MSNTTAVALLSAKFLNGGRDIGVQRHPETKSTWTLPLIRAFTRSLAPCRRSLPLPWRSTLPVIEETSLVSFGHRVVRDRPVAAQIPSAICIRICLSVRPSALPIPVSTTHTSSPSPFPRPGWRGGVSNPGKLCFAAGEGSLVLALSQARSLILALDRVRAHSRQGQGRERTTRDEDRQHGEPDQVARCKRARAGPCRSPGLGQRRTLEAPTLPRGPRHPPMRQTRPLGGLLLFSFSHPSSQRAWVTASREVGRGLPCPSVETNAWSVWGVAAVVPSVRD